MTPNELTPEALDAAGRAMAGQEGPVHMLNLVRYHPAADYRGLGEFPPCSGREAYVQRYVPAFARVAQSVAPDVVFKISMLAGVLAVLVAPAGEAWDDLVIVEYPSFEALRRIIECREYEVAAAPHRRAALADWRFLATRKIELPA